MSFYITNTTLCCDSSLHYSHLKPGFLPGSGSGFQTSQNPDPVFKSSAQKWAETAPKVIYYEKTMTEDRQRI